jgi:hypothetical protein
VKDRLGDQRGGSEWEPIKILLLRELRQYPKFTTKDSHTSLPRSRSHNGRTNPRNKPQTIPKWKHEARTKGLSYSETAQADCPRSPGGLSAGTADGPRPTADGPLITNRTTQPAPPHADGPYHVFGRSASNSCRVDCPRRSGRLSAKPLSTKSHWPTRSKQRRSRTREEHEEHLGKTLHADCPHPPCGRSARCKLARGQQPENQLESTLPPIEGPIRRTREGGVNGSR